jgi:hypothetical protein
MESDAHWHAEESDGIELGEIPPAEAPPTAAAL